MRQKPFSPVFARGQALLELMPVRFKSGLNLEIQIRPDPSSAIFLKFQDDSVIMICNVILIFLSSLILGEVKHEQEAYQTKFI